MSALAPPRPIQVQPFPNGQLGIAWNDGHESIYDGFALRCACACAKCVDEGTGRKVLRDESVPRDVRVKEVSPVGNYGIGIAWSDGHDTGIYTFATLRSVCPCPDCSGRA